MEELELHYTQQEALDFLVDSINCGKTVVGLIGAGGVGKSEILSRLEDEYLETIDQEKELPKQLFFSATTNKAVSRLLQVLPSAATVHSLTAKPKYTKLYEELDGFYEKLGNLQDDKKEKFYESFYFYYSQSFIKQYGLNLLDHRTINDVLAFVKMSTFSEEMFDRYIIKDPINNSVIVIDEASMLPSKSIYDKGSLITIGLDAVQQVFDSVIIVGDNSQLPPVNGTSSFIGLECYELTKNFRSELELLDAIQWARDGKWFGNFKNQNEKVKVVNGITDSWYISTFKRTDVAHIVYRNNTRHAITRRVRQDKVSTPYDGEPVLLRGRGTDEVAKGEIGVYNEDERTIEFEKGDIKLKRYHLFDEYAGNKYGSLQYGYAITAHMSQGSSFGNVIVHAYDIPSFLSKEEKRKWLYTAVSRARKSLTIIL